MSPETLNANGLLTLARSGSLGDRDRLLIAIAKLCSSSQDCSRPEVQTLLGDIFMGLVARAERDIRLRLAETLAETEWAPHDLIFALANDEIEIARPVIAQSPVLTDGDLIVLLADTTVDHQIEVARRADIGADVVAAVMDQAEADVLAALAGNATADVSILNLTRLVHLSGRMAALRAPLARHPGLTPDLAGLLYSWVGDTLRGVLAQRFPAHKPLLAQAVAKAVRDGRPSFQRPDDLDDEGSMQRRLVQKLQAANQLRAGLLIRALHEGKLVLFKTGLGALGNLPYQAIEAALDCDSPNPLARACAAAGIDRSAFPTILGLVRGLNSGRPGDAVENGADHPQTDAPGAGRRIGV